MNEMMAYAIDQADAGWRWRVFDANGGLLIGGRADSKTEAEAAAIRVFARGLAEQEAGERRLAS